MCIILWYNVSCLQRQLNIKRKKRNANLKEFEVLSKMLESYKGQINIENQEL